jgi:hypothetical protein
MIGSKERDFEWTDVPFSMTRNTELRYSTSTCGAVLLVLADQIHYFVSKPPSAVDLEI